MTNSRRLVCDAHAAPLLVEDAGPGVTRLYCAHCRVEGRSPRAAVLHRPTIQTPDPDDAHRGYA